MEQSINPISSLSGTIEVPGDKSISHRAIMLGSIAEGETLIEGFLNGEDCLSTIEVFRQLGVNIERLKETTYVVKGNGSLYLSKPKKTLYVGNSGTTIRLVSGLLIGQEFSSTITGDESIVKRPMGRIIEPLRLMGANIDGSKDGKYAPISIKGIKINGIDYQSPIASAQVKSSILLAGLLAYGKTIITEPYLSRDHSEKMLMQFGADIHVNNNSVTLNPGKKLQGQHIIVPGDFSSAAFFIAAALIVPNSNIIIKNVGINKTRIGFLEAVKEMNGNVTIDNYRLSGYEPVADIIVKSSELKGISISGEWIPKLIDELPLLAVVASQADGITEVSGAQELRVKETDRISTIVSEMKKVGVNIEERDDGFSINGKQSIVGGRVTSQGDHRIGMAMAIAGLIAKNTITIEKTEAINISYPTFFEDLSSIINN